MNCTHILTRTQEKMFEDMFLVKIVNKGTSLNFLTVIAQCNIRLRVIAAIKLLGTFFEDLLHALVRKLFLHLKVATLHVQ